MHTLSIDTATAPVGFRHPLPQLVQSRAPGHPQNAGVGFGTVPNSRRFVTMLSDYGVSGGLARGSSLGRLLDGSQRGDYISLARLIAADKIFSFSWHANRWILIFQFDQRDLSVRPGLRRMLAELKPVFDGWELTVWFLQRNSALHTKRPVDLLDSDLAGVLEAARTDRFVAAGLTVLAMFPAARDESAPPQPLSTTVHREGAAAARGSVTGRTKLPWQTGRRRSWSSSSSSRSKRRAQESSYG